MPHFNHKPLNFKYKDYQVLAIPNLHVRQFDIVEYLSGPGVNDTYCLLKDRVTNEQFKVPLSKVQVVQPLNGKVVFLVKSPGINELSVEGHHHV